MQKKGDIWISAILYFGLGIVVISILLAAGLPVINKLKDKNIVIQSKQVMHILDQNIREVLREGPGSQRLVSINVKKGNLIVDAQHDVLAWSYDGAHVLISEPGLLVPEGNLNILTNTTQQKGIYNISILANYASIANINRPAGSQNTLLGLTDLVVRNEGLDAQQKIMVSISEANR